MVGVAARLCADQSRVQRHAGNVRQADRRHQRRLLHSLPHSNRHGPPRTDQLEHNGPPADLARGGHVRRLSPDQPAVGQDEFATVHRAGQHSCSRLRPDRECEPGAGAGESRQVRGHEDRRGTAQLPRPRHPSRGRAVLPDRSRPVSAAAATTCIGPNGFRLEDAFSEFKSSPAARCKHQTCQDCHMGIVPGMPERLRLRAGRPASATPSRRRASAPTT